MTQLQSGLLLDEALNTVAFKNKNAQLEQKQFELLLYLLNSSNQLVNKEDIHRHVWQQTIVSDSALSRNVGALRRAFDALEITHISLTVKPKKGYILNVTPLEDDGYIEDEPQDASSPSSIESSQLFNTKQTIVVIAFLVIVIGLLSILYDHDDGQITALPIISEAITNQSVSNSTVAIDSKGEFVSFIQYEDGVTYSNNSDGYSTIIREGKTIERYRIKGWVKDFVFTENYLSAHKLLDNKCLIYVQHLTDENDSTTIPCEDHVGGSAMAYLSDKKLIFSDGNGSANYLYTVDLVNHSMRKSFTTPNNVRDIYSIRVSPQLDKLAFLALTYQGGISLFVGENNGITEFSEIRLETVPITIQWLNNHTIAYIDTKNALLVAHTAQSLEVNYYSLGDKKLTGYFSTNKGDILVSYITGQQYNYSIINQNNVRLPELSFSTQLSLVSIKDEVIYFVEENAGVSNVFARDDLGQLQLSFYEHKNSILDYKISGSAIIVSTEHSVDVWEDNVLIKSYANAVDHIIGGTDITQLFAFKEGNLLRLNESGIDIYVNNVASAYAAKSNIWLTFTYKPGIYVRNNKVQTLYSNGACGGMFAHIKYVDEKGLYCLLKDGPEALFYVDFLTNTESLIETDGPVIAVHNNHILTKTMDTQIIHLGMLSMPELQ